MNLSRVFLSFVWPSGRIFVTAARVTNAHSIYTTVGIVAHSKNILSRDSVIIDRLRTGHCRLTRSYLLSGDDLPTCDSCTLPLTVKHFLLDCPGLQDIRENYFKASSIKELFESVNNHTIIDFIRDTHFYHQL